MVWGNRIARLASSLVLRWDNCFEFASERMQSVVLKTSTGYAFLATTQGIFNSCCDGFR